MRSFKLNLLTHAMLGAMCCGAAVPAMAQDSASPAAGNQLEEIVVTAQRREESLQKVPVAVTAITGDSLGQRGLNGVEDLSSAVPGLFIAVSSATQPFLRGIGNASTTIGNESSTAVYVDGVYYSRLPVGMFALANIERVEVLKGPQGTLFGRNSSAGVIQLVTKNPTETSIKGGASYGRRDFFDGNLYVSARFSDRLAADVSVAGQKFTDGYGHNDVLNLRAGYVDYLVARTKWVFDATDTTRISLSGFYAYSKLDSQGNTFPGFVAGYISNPRAPLFPMANYYDNRNGTPQYNTSKSRGVTLKLEQELGVAKITSTTAYIKTVTDQVSDSDYTERDDQIVLYGGPVKQFTQELQLSSLSGGPLQWQVGAFYFRTRSEYDERTFFYSPAGTQAGVLGTEGFFAPAHQLAKSYAFYGQATYEIIPRVKITGGLRYTMDRNSADGILIRGNGNVLRDPPAGKDKFNKVTFRTALDFQVTDDALLYASFSRGFKSAVFNLLTYNPVPNKAEVLDAYEAGFKTTLFDRRIRLNGAVYHYKLTNPQVQLLTNGTVLFSNADGARVNGAELDLQAAVTTGLTFRASGSYVNSKYTKYPNAPTGPQNPNSPFGSISPFTSVNAKGNYLPFAAKWTGNIGFDYKVDIGPGSLAFSADYSYNSGYYFEPDNLLHQKSFELVSGQIKYSPAEHFGIRVWGKNLLGEKYATRAGSTAGPSSFTYVPGQPKMYGLGFDFNF